MLHNINIDSKYLVTDTGTSDGTQIKYFFDNNWYKIDRYGDEGICEDLVSTILNLSNYDKEKYLNYQSVLINNTPGCISKNFLSLNERFVTIYRLHLNVMGTDPAMVTSKMDYDDAINYIIDFVKKQTNTDITEYLADTFTLDALILNEDRHFNNLGLIFDGSGYRTAPIFDNGKSLFIGNPRYDSSKPISENKKIAFSKAFSGNFILNRNYLRKYSSLSFDYEKIIKYLESKDLNTDNVYSRLYKLCNRV